MIYPIFPGCYVRAFFAVGFLYTDATCDLVTGLTLICVGGRVMTKEQAVFALDGLEPGDNEAQHGNAERILLDFLRNNGHTAVADAFERARDRIEFWYA